MGAWAGNPCRLCLRENSKNPIPNNPFFLYSIFDASGVKISPADGFPQQLCNECYLFINQCNIFREKSQESQKTLLNIKTRSENPNINDNIGILNITANPIEIKNIQHLETEIQEYNHDESNSNIVSNLNSSSDSINIENKDIFDGIAYLNSENINLHQDNEHLIQDNKNTSQDNGDLQSDNRDLNSDNEDLYSDNEDLNSGSEDFNLGNANSKLNVNSGSLSTDSKNISIYNEGLYTINKNGKKAKCNECGKEMLLYSIKKHLMRHDLSKKVLKLGSKMKDMGECDTCGRRMAKKRLVAHFLLHDLPGGKLNCKHCGKKFRTPSRLLQHCRAKHGYEKVDKCTYCDYMGCSPYEVKFHMKRHEAGGLTCNVCAKTFKYKKFLWEHMALHEDPKKQIYGFKCPYCKNTSLSKDTIRIHMKRKHKASNTQDIIKLYDKECLEIKTKVQNKNSQKKREGTEKPLDAVNEENDCPNITKVEIVNERVIHLEGDGSVQILKGKNTKQSNVEKDSLNLNNTNLVQDDNEFLHLDYKASNPDTETNIENNENLVQDDTEILEYEALDSDLEDLSFGNEDLSFGNEDLSLNTADLNSANKDLNQDIEKIKTNNIVVEKKRRNKQTKLQTVKSRKGTNKVKDRTKVIGSTNIKDRKKVKCKVCELEMLPLSLSKHLKLHELYGDNLKKRFKNYESYKKKPRVECDTCGQKMPKSRIVAHLLKHDVTNETGILICKHCGKNFDRPFTLLRHCRAKHGYAKEDKCSHCDYMGCSAYEVKMHEKNEHQGGESFICEVCGFTSKRKPFLQEHMLEHSTEGPKVLCTECPEVFYFNRQLAQHKHRYHNRSGLVPNFVCPYCPHTRVLKVTIAVHMKKKHGATNTKDIKKIFVPRNEDTIKRRSKKKRLTGNNITESLKINSNPIRLDQDPNSLVIRNAGSLNESVDFLSAFHQHLDSDKVDLIEKDLSPGNVEMELTNIVGENFEVVNEVCITGDLVNFEKDLSGDNKYKCKICGMKLKRNFLKRHLLKHARQNAPKLSSIICEYCGRTLKRKRELIRHLKAKHGYEKVHKCSYCDYMGADSHQIKVHERTHTGEMPYSCDVCLKAFRYKATLMAHMETHDASLKNTVQCEICQKTVRMRYYRSHREGHNHRYPRKSRQCEACGAMVQKHNMKEHMASHTGMVNHLKCEHCTKTFNRLSRLLRHCKAAHGYERTDKCNYCDYKACSPSEVKLHERSHTGEKSFTCSTCSKSFVHRQGLKRHMATRCHKEGKKSLKCYICSNWFRTSRLLSTHLIQKHSKDIQGVNE